MFENFIKITRAKYENNTTEESSQDDIKFPAYSDSFIDVKAVKTNNLKDFLGALRSFNEKLDDFIVKLYRSEENKALHKEYDDVVLKLRKKYSQIKYLSSYFETIELKIEAYQKQLFDKEATSRRMQHKRLVIQNKLINLKKSIMKNQSKVIKSTRKPILNGLSNEIISNLQNEQDVELNLVPITNVLSNYNENIDDDNIDSFSDWTDID